MSKKATLSFLSVLLLTTSFGNLAFAEEEKPDFATGKMTGNWGGARDTLFDKGFSFDIYYKADFWRNFSGGENQNNNVLDNLDIKMTVDGEKAFNSPGTTLFLYLLNNNGGRINDTVGTNGGIDNMEAPTHAFKLYEAWVEQNLFDDYLSILVGLHDLNTEFYVTDTSGLFINPTYGIGTEMAATGDNGPSVFPATGLAARIALQPTEYTYVKAAIFDGVPGDPNNPKGTHITLKDNEGALVVAEGGVKTDEIGHFAAGVWEYTARRPDQVTAADMQRSKGMYFLADKSVYKNGSKNVNAFGRLGFAAGDVEQFKHNWSLGFVADGFIPSRPDGQIGFAVSTNSNSSKYKVANTPVKNSETQVELTYRDMITPWLSIQPDLQYTINPGTTPGLQNAWTGGVRLGVDF